MRKLSATKKKMLDSQINCTLYHTFSAILDCIVEGNLMQLIIYCSIMVPCDLFMHSAFNEYTVMLSIVSLIVLNPLAFFFLFSVDFFSIFHEKIVNCHIADTFSLCHWTLNRFPKAAVKFHLNDSTKWNV